ncbi:MAG: hypothetical protein J6S14_12390 [Clostridia bacterium]|nr:hypothetical protein [Clostridia bacterium]
MKDYKKLVEALRHCNGTSFMTCRECQYNNSMVSCIYKMLQDAADAIEELLSFAHYVADKVTMSDEDWEDYHEAFAEVSCRKLVKLGIVSVDNDAYVYRQNNDIGVQE